LLPALLKVIVGTVINEGHAQEGNQSTGRIPTGDGAGRLPLCLPSLICVLRNRLAGANNTKGHIGLNCYAHTAEDENGNRLPETSGRWQLLKDHLRNVAKLARRFAEPLGLADEAELAGLLPSPQPHFTHSRDSFSSRQVFSS